MRTIMNAKVFLPGLLLVAHTICCIAQTNVMDGALFHSKHSAISYGSSVTASAMPDVQSSTFRSTSYYASQWSSESLTPMLNADGSIAMVESYNPTNESVSGPRRIAPITPTDNPTPIGDGKTSLLIMSLLLSAIVSVRQNRKKSSDETKKYVSKTNEE